MINKLLNLIRRKSVFLILFIVVVLFALSFVPFFSPNVPINSFIPYECAAQEDGKNLDFSYATTMPVETGAGAAILIDAKSLDVLAQSNVYAELGMASTTKIMTGLLALELLPLNANITIPKEATGIEGSSIYLTEGEILTAEQLLYGLLLESGNDSAVALAIAAAGSEEMFVALMNAKAKEIGMEHTHFVNPHGLSDDEHYTCAADLALLTATALQNETFAKMVATKKMTIPYKGVENGRFLLNHNKLLGRYDGIVGVKTGYTKATGRCLVTAFKNGDQILVAVTLDCSGDWSAHKAMYEWAKDRYYGVKVAEENFVSRGVRVVGGESDLLICRNTEEAYICLPKGHEVREIVEVPNFVSAPIKAGDVIGYVTYYDGEKELAKLPLRAVSDVDVKKINFWEKIFS